jgi:Xaa-Pro dipeptidase
VTLHFDAAEFAQRRSRVAAAIAAQDWFGLLIFKQESMFYLTGYDTSGYSMFQGMWLGADGGVALLTRSADRLQSRITSTLEDIRIWVDGDGANPGNDLRDMIADYGARGQRVGVEYHAYGLTAQRGKMVDAALAGFCATEDGSDLVREIRLVKSAAELSFVRNAGRLCDEAWHVANRDTVPGAFLGRVYADMQHAVLCGDGDPSASRWPMGAGDNAMMVRYHTGKETVSANDHVQHEFAAAYRHYHACAMSVVTTGKPSASQQAMFAACQETLRSCQEALRPGNTVGEVYAAHTTTLDKLGLGHAALNACGYSLGISYPPTWMDWPMIWRDNPQELLAGMVFFIHIILLDDKTGLTMSLGETAIVTADSCERITHGPDHLVCN